MTQADSKAAPAATHAADGAGQLQIWFDFASPYSFLAMERIEPIAASHGVTVDYRPFLLGPVFKARGWDDSPFRLFPDKGEYMMREVARLAAKYGIRYRRPTVFPRVGVLPSRVAYIGLQEAWGRDFCIAMFRANFVDDLDIQQQDVVRERLRALGVDADAVLARAASDEIKQAFRAQVDRAQALGVFGAPMMFAGTEMFWGNDRVEDAVRWARDGGGPVA
ncbi:2-hydroxychromene-2-carboxylate isomerase [Bordetella bronchialis]|uniref:2-hydroxychromene-2-carboxylate isomerase n=1 Tax=Bordetella bronchialis TaxID=463025 RepID=A0A193FPC2_9BORD|nr:2-hydroxychromene-2-carboxylate isomerase [Bordetella bronchialis]ANN69026.1 2-hydroxychromene-2-carboxylate isomerase [Bordetella bronchialis]ANN74176.1 2-hydroxychromene-2-carboxylate isomerase [Bordetella bronchialis]